MISHLPFKASLQFKANTRPLSIINYERRAAAGIIAEVFILEKHTCVCVCVCTHVRKYLGKA